MELPINDEELGRLVWWTQHMMGEEELHKRLKLVKEVRDANPNGPYKKILREEHGMAI